MIEIDPGINGANAARLPSTTGCGLDCDFKIHLSCDLSIIKCAPGSEPAGVRSLDAQLDQIQQEAEELQQQIERLQEHLHSASSIEATLSSTEKMLQRLRNRLEEPLTWEVKRQLVEALIERILVHTVETEQGKKEARITVTYRFGISLTL